MKTLLERINEEGNRNNTLRNTFNEEANLPNKEEVIKQLGSEEFFKAASNVTEFRFRVKLELLKSNHYFVNLMETYLKECDNKLRTPETDLNLLREWVQWYEKDTKEITEYLVKQHIRGYESGW